MHNYNWLFDMNLAAADGTALDGIDLSLFPETFGDEFNGNSSSDAFAMSSLGGAHSGVSWDGLLGESPTAVPLEALRSPDQSILQPSTHESAPPPSNNSVRSDQRSSQQVSQTHGETLSNATTASANVSRGQRTSAAPRKQAEQFTLERPMALLNPNTRLPKLDALAREQVLDLIERMRPVMPNDHVVTREDPLLSLESLQTFSDLYFSHFNATYPLIHQATFDPSNVDKFLLLAVLLLGATYSEKDAHQLAVSVSEHSRRSITDFMIGLYP